MSETVKQKRVIYMGTPDFAVPALEALVRDGWNVVLVVSQPDRPVGRKQVLKPTDVKACAQKYDLPVYQPEHIRSDEAFRHLAEYRPDVIVTAAYGQIIDKRLLELPTYGCYNLHASLLPRFRGSSPIQAAIMAGDQETGVTLMKMDEGCDTGDIVAQKRMPINDHITGGELFDSLAEMSADLILEVLPLILIGGTCPVSQDDNRACKAPKLARSDGKIDWTKSAEEIHNLIRALDPWPGAYTYYDGKRIKIKESAVVDGEVSSASPGEIVHNVDKLTVATGEGLIDLLQIHPASGRCMPTCECCHNYPIGSNFQNDDGR